jgi:hypothetical protein
MDTCFMAEAIALLNDDSSVPDAMTSPPRRAPIQIEYATGTDKWHMKDTPGVHMCGGTDITKTEAMSKSAEDLTRGIYRSANTIAPVLVEDANGRGHRMPIRLDQTRAWTRWNNSPRQLDYTFCQVCQHRRPDTLINADACHTVDRNTITERCTQGHVWVSVFTVECLVVIRKTKCVIAKR